jgi:predicted N-formylglutamate amidohydrolase
VISVDASPWPLIGAGDPPPFSYYNRQGKAPFLLVCDHAGRAFPAAMDCLGLAPWALKQHVACDPGAAALTRALADHFDAPAILGGYSRLLIDLNRRLELPSAIPSVSDGIAIPGNLEVDGHDRKQRIESFFEPYHAAIESRLGQAMAAGQVPALLSIHTCSPVFDRVTRPWHVGVMWDRDPRIARSMLEELRTMEGICAGDNEPYSGQHPNDYTIDFHAERQGLPCVGIEVRQDLVADDDGVRQWAGVLAAALDKVLSRPALYQLNGGAATK